MKGKENAEWREMYKVRKENRHKDSISYGNKNIPEMSRKLSSKPFHIKGGQANRASSSKLGKDFKKQQMLWSTFMPSI